jgi:hypothetical protein
MKKVLLLLVAVIALTNAVLGQAKEKAGDNIDTLVKKQLITETRYVGIGLGYIAGLSKNAPYRAGVNLHDVFGKLVLNRRLALEGQFDIDFRFAHNEDWNRRAFNGWRPSAIPDVFSCLSTDFTLGAYPVIAKRKNFSAMVGPMLGITYITARSASGDILVRSPRLLDLKPCYGLKASALVGQHFIFSAQYLMMPITKVDAGTLDFPVTFNVLRVCATYHYLPSSTRLYKKMMARRAKKKAAATGAESSQ